MNPKFQGLIALVISAFLGGAVTPSLVRLGVQSADPFIFNFLRSGLSLIFLLPVFFQEREKLKELNFRKLTLFAGVGCGVNIALFAVGLMHTTVVASQLLYALLPITVPILGYFITKEKVNSKKVWGAGIGFIGILLLIVFSRSPEQRLALGSFYGNGLIFIAMLFYTFFLVISKLFTKSYSPAFISATTYLGLTIFFVPFTLYKLMSGTGSVNWSPQFLLVLLGIGLVSVVFMFALQYGIRRVSAMTVAVTILLAPEFGAVAGARFFGEQITPVLIVSMMLVITGVLVSVSGEKETLWQRVKAAYAVVADRLLMRN